MIDYRKQGWGHKIIFHSKNDDNSHTISGFLTPPPKDGDEFLHEFDNGENSFAGVCELKDVNPYSDPHDMYKARAGLVRIATDEDIQRAE